MAEKRRFLLRLDADTHAAVEKWAADDLRSVNGQIEFLLTEALKRAGRVSRGKPGGGTQANSPHDATKRPED